MKKRYSQNGRYKKNSKAETEIKSGELFVFIEDECHLLWGDTLGYIWGKKNERTGFQ